MHPETQCCEAGVERVLTVVTHVNIRVRDVMEGQENHRPFFFFLS